MQLTVEPPWHHAVAFAEFFAGSTSMCAAAEHTSPPTAPPPLQAVAASALGLPFSLDITTPSALNRYMQLAAGPSVSQPAPDSMCSGSSPTPGTRLASENEEQKPPVWMQCETPEPTTFPSDVVAHA